MDVTIGHKCFLTSIFLVWKIVSLFSQPF
ncbi:unnamed protein product [Larinioides sclopetarius]|uniref:Uncharacterized protein n=1 Tax=Larinioides sclopetarius TaxID=280406 RepID=A0AAV1ZM24_9ARAC